MVLTASKLRENIYRLLDRILETGEPVDVERNGKLLRILPAEPGGKLKHLKRRPLIEGDPEALVHLDWSREWKPKLK